MKPRLTDHFSIRQQEREVAFSAFEQNMSALERTFQGIINSSGGVITEQEALFAASLATLEENYITTLTDVVDSVTAAQAQLAGLQTGLTESQNSLTTVLDGLDAYAATQQNYVLALAGYTATLDQYEETLAEKVLDFDNFQTASETTITDLEDQFTSLKSTTTVLNQSYQSVLTEIERVDQSVATLSQDFGIVESGYYGSNKSNTTFRMGSNGSTNWDGIVYNETTNEFLFKADADQAGNDVGESLIRANKMRLMSGTDASPTSTNHALEIVNDAGHYAKFDNDEVVWSDGNKSGAVVWEHVSQNTDQAVRYEGTSIPVGSSDISLTWDNGSKGMFISEITRLSAYRVFDIMHVSMVVTASGPFLPPSSHEPAIVLTISDFNDLLETLKPGICGIISQIAYGNCMVRMQGSNFDLPEMPFLMVADSPADGIQCSCVDTTHLGGDPAVNLELLRFYINFTCRVAGYST